KLVKSKVSWLLAIFHAITTINAISAKSRRMGRDRKPRFWEESEIFINVSHVFGGELDRGAATTQFSVTHTEF
ncbi:hypothetical protein, partial [Achromobacter sp. AGC25]